MPPLNPFSRSCLALAVGQAVATPIAQAATIQVNSGLDMVKVDAVCTLREAVLSANSNMDSGSGCAKGSSGLDTITFDSTVTNVNLSKADDIDITETLNISGAGVANLTVNGMNNGRIFRIDNVDVSIDSMTLTGGSVSVTNELDPEYEDDGGAILVTGGNLTLVNMLVTGNHANSGGGGISLFGSFAFPSMRPSNVQLSDSTIEANTVNGTGGGIKGFRSIIEVSDSLIKGNGAINKGGGGIANEQGVITIRNSTLDANTTGINGRGGAISHTASEGDTALTEVLEQSRIINNSAVQGGAIFQEGVGIHLQNCVISSNTSDKNGGGISFNNAGASVDFVMNNCSISSNSSGSRGGGLLINTNQSVSIINSTISSNSSAGFGDGAGVLLTLSDDDTAVATIVNSTVSGNSITGGNAGGGIAIDRGRATIANSTISDNFSDADGGGVSLTRVDAQIINTTINDNHAVSTGAGLLVVAGEEPVEILNSIIANSQGSADCATATTLVIASQNSIIEDASCGTNAMAVDPILAPLADNGGATQTHALLNDSPAINAGDVSACNNALLAGKDQRGINHVGTCDIGSYESPVSESSFFVVPLPSGKSVIFEL